MVLADTSVVIAHYRNPTARVQRLIAAHSAAVCGVTVAEVYGGARTPAEAARCAAILGIFGRVVTPEDVWEVVGQHQVQLRAGGLTVPLSDTIIATVALTHELELWTYDSHFTLMQRLLPALKLFEEPPYQDSVVGAGN
jgi:predicted nucleic acid-binding protein